MNKDIIKEMQELAKSKNGVCLSTTYVNNHTNLRWQCAESHMWKTIPKVIKRGGWCPVCAIVSRAEKKRKYSIEDMRALAASRGGKCLSTRYTNFHSKLKWRCAEGHIWKATWAHIKAEQWCRLCGFVRAASKQRSSIEEMQKIARARGGECLSSEYINNRTKLRWRCGKGHLWEADQLMLFQAIGAHIVLAIFDHQSKKCKS